MSEPEVGKRRRRSARVYVRPDKLTPEELEQRLAVVARYFPSDADDDLTPAHSQASAMLDADCDKSTGAVKHSAGNPVPNGYAANRVSEPLIAGHQAPSTGDHGPGAGRPHGIAEHHPGANIEQSTTSVTPWFSMRSFNGDNEYHDRDVTHPTGTVGVSFLDLRGAASPMPDCLLPAANPVARRMDHQSRGSATPPTPGHNLADPASHAAPAAVKGARLGGYAAMEVLRQNARDALNR